MSMNISGIELDGETLTDVEMWIERLSWQLEELGWDKIIRELNKNRKYASAEDLFGHPNINVIPGAAKSACHPAVIALASGTGRHSTSLGSVLNKLSEHLLECDGITKLAVLVTDTIDPRFMEERKRLFEIHRERKGVQFVLLLVRDRSLHAVPIPKWASRMHCAPS